LNIAPGFLGSFDQFQEVLNIGWNSSCLPLLRSCINVFGCLVIKAECVFPQANGKEHKLYSKAALYLQKSCHSDIKADDKIYMGLNLNKNTERESHFEYGV
jgi:hypothetical protein